MAAGRRVRCYGTGGGSNHANEDPHAMNLLRGVLSDRSEPVFYPSDYASHFDRMPIPEIDDAGHDARRAA